MERLFLLISIAMSNAMYRYWWNERSNKMSEHDAPRSLSPTRAPAPKRDTLVRNKTNHGRAISKFSIVMELLKLFKRNN